MHPANERRRYDVTTSLIDWAHTYTDPGTTFQYMKQHENERIGGINEFKIHEMY